MGDTDNPFAVVRPSWVRWRIVALLLLFSFMSWFNRMSIQAAGDIHIIGHFQIDKPTFGLINTAFFLAYTLCMTPSGWLIDRVGAWRALVFMGLGSGLFVAATGLCGFFARGPGDAGTLLLSLLTIRALMGAASAPIYPASGRITAHWIPLRQRATVNGMITCAAVVGNASTYMVFGFLIDKFTWPVAFVITGAATAALAIVWTLYATNRPEEHPAVNDAERNWISPGAAAPLDDVPIRVGAASRAAPDGVVQSPALPVRLDSPDLLHAPPERPATSWLRLLTNRSLIFLTLSYAAVGYFEYAAFFSMPDYLKTNAGLEEDQRRVCVGIINLTMALGMPLGGLLSDRLQPVLGYRFGRAVVPAAGMTVGALFLGAGVLSSNPVLVVLWFALAMGALGTCEGPSWATAIELGGRRGGTSAGIFNTGGNVLGSAAPPLVPWIGARMAALGWGQGWGLATAGFVSVMGAALWWWIDPTERCAETSSKDPPRSEHS
jgi:ACS family glucarate transporter-like MFS transporter